MNPFLKRSMRRLFAHHDQVHDNPCTYDCAKIFALADEYERATGDRVPWGNHMEGWVQ